MEAGPWENHIRTFELNPGSDVNWNQINAFLKRMGADGWRVSGFQFSKTRVAFAFTRAVAGAPDQAPDRKPAWR